LKLERPSDEQGDSRKWLAVDPPLLLFQEDVKRKGTTNNQGGKLINLS
jgi:hypothetical protein